MIGQLCGKIELLSGMQIVVVVQGIGYEVEMPTNCQAKFDLSQTEQLIYTHFVVRDDAQLLFGFSSRKLRDVFRILIKASGVGPKAALAILSHFELNNLISTIENQEVGNLVAVKGIGAKLAKKFVVELKGALLPYTNINDAILSPKPSSLNAVKAALEALGYKANQAESVAKTVVSSRSDLSTEQLVKQALQLINS